MRLHPSTPLSLPHFSFDACDDVDGYRVPANTRLLINIWAIGRDPAAWEAPLEFRPERFLPGGAAEKVDPLGNYFELIPFGAGRRICPGMAFGLAHIELALAALLFHFDWALPGGLPAEELDMTEAFGIATPRRYDLLVVASPRSSL